MPSDQSLAPVRGRRLPREARLMIEKPLYVRGKIDRCPIATRAIRLQGLHHDPVQITIEIALEFHRVGLPRLCNSLPVLPKRGVSRARTWRSRILRREPVDERVHRQL